MVTSRAKPEAWSESERLRALRAMGATACVAACRRIAPGGTALPVVGPATALERRRLDLDPGADPHAAVVPSVEDLIKLGGGRGFVDLDARGAAVPGRRSPEENRRSGWLLFSYAGPGEVLCEAMELFSPLTIALALRSRDPYVTPTRPPRPPDHDERVQRLLTRAAELSAEVSAIDLVLAMKSSKALSDAELEHERDQRARHASRLRAEAEDLADSGDSGGVGSRWLDGGARAVRDSDDVPKNVRNEIADFRRRYWEPVADALGDAEPPWRDRKLADLIVTGSGFVDDPKGKVLPGWAFPLCPLDAARGRDRIAEALKMERARARARGDLP